MLALTFVPTTYFRTLGARAGPDDQKIFWLHVGDTGKQKEMADNISAIHTALQFACSQNPSELKLGEKQLRVWEEQSGYYAGLAVGYKWNIID